MKDNVFDRVEEGTTTYKDNHIITFLIFVALLVGTLVGLGVAAWVLGALF